MRRRTMNKSSHKKTPADNPFLELTWVDIEDWAGSKIVSRGKSYQRSGAVRELGITADNDLIAWVAGSTRYATRVAIKGGKLSSACTCPYGFNCKHGVAVLIEFLYAVKHKKEIPTVPPGDERIGMIDEGVNSQLYNSEVDWEGEL
jgi:uncharacterized Zn finger protein